MKALDDLGLAPAHEPEYVKLPPADMPPAPPRLIEPLICDSRSMFFGPQGVGKGVLVAFAIAALAEGDGAFIPGSSVARQVQTGVLDWEDNADEWAERLLRVGVPVESVPYLAPRGPLTDRKVLAYVMDWADAEGVELLAIDSVVPAAGAADAMKPEGATAFYQALRTIGRPSLALAHVAKAQAQAEQPFGSTYWSTPSRLVWRVERLESDQHIVKLVNTKHSRWARAGELLLKVGWAESGPLRLTSALSLTMERDAAPLIDRIVLALGVAGEPLTAEDLAAKTGSDAHTIRKTAQRNPGRVVVAGYRPALYSLPGAER